MWKTMLKTAMVAAIVFLLAACVSSPADRFAKVREGMTKDDVLDIMGSPTRIEMVFGKEKWIYDYWEGSDKNVYALKQVTFLNHNVISVGEDDAERERVKEINASDEKREQLHKAQKEAKARAKAAAEAQEAATTNSTTVIIKGQAAPTSEERQQPLHKDATFQEMTGHEE